MSVSVRPLLQDKWCVALGVMHRAFVDEPFTVDMYGEQILDRWGGSWGLYAPLERADYTLGLGAYLDEALVGVLVGSLPYRCHLCHVLAVEPRPGDHDLAVEWEFNQNIAESHSTLNGHAWVAKVAVEPALHGLGVGRALLGATATAIRAVAPTQVVLECAPDRVGFYQEVGFEQISTFPDPTGPDASLMGQWVR